MSGDLEDPLVKATPGDGEERIQKEIDCWGRIGYAVVAMTLPMYFITLIIVLVYSIPVLYERDPVYVSCLTANGTSTSWDTDIYIHYSVPPYSINLDDVRASLRNSENGSVLSASSSTSMDYSSDGLALLLHAVFPRATKEEEGAVVAVDLLVEANANIKEKEMRWYMRIECTDLKIQFQKGVGRLKHSRKKKKGDDVRPFRNRQLYQGIRFNHFHEYLDPADLDLLPCHSIWRSI